MNNNGRLGSKLHEDIVNFTRNEAASYFRAILPDLDWCFIYDDRLMYMVLGTIPQQYNKDVKIPDGVWACNDEVFIIEIGQYDPAKWPYPVIHIGFNGIVSTINCNSGFIRLIADEIECMLGYHHL